MKNRIFTLLFTLLIVVGLSAQTTTPVSADKKVEESNLNKNTGKEKNDRKRQNRDRKKNHKRGSKEAKKDHKNRENDLRSEKSEHRQNREKHPNKKAKRDR